ncbi:PIN domain nuclease [Nonomuraea sp. KC401]|uniref:Ribonuclease VapC n=2 Tax=Nonomuraea mesophila TaxID=2530382 RepID=A0A4R5FGV0_9ACTN|nr:PIN domain nuclease [Nonomuraea sp. KC401]NBE96504.1 PIN domain-containing protein [Nonomuraea sp. K271]TDE50923.1 PIN domain nuclease [Nonomuraea mesophila]TLF73025.1 PIN domain nuclease [Nonomuraea sp. KC401]
MATAGLMYLLDKSALARIRTSDAVAKALHPLYAARAVATCSIIDLEVLYSARDIAHYQRILQAQRECVLLPMDQEVQARALDVQKQLVAISQHRGIGPNDLLIAACAEVHGATVLHYDRDFDVISEVTGQPALWVVPPGSVP